MKAFKKWWGNRNNAAFQWCAEEAWRAALGQVQKIIVEDSNGPGTPKDLMEWLHKELDS